MWGVVECMKGSGNPAEFFVPPENYMLPQQHSLGPKHCTNSFLSFLFSFLSDHFLKKNTFR